MRHITFVDNGKVSFSNPVRQPLFNFEDCLGDGQNKAYCAAEALRKIYPGVHSSGHPITIPMLGHEFTDPEKSKRDFVAFKELVDDHDAVFILMDTREARWLPTLMAKVAGKVVLNAALGFDTYVAMRHGGRAKEDAVALGCYFCNDVVAPADVSSCGLVISCYFCSTDSLTPHVNPTVRERADSGPTVYCHSARRSCYSISITSRTVRIRTAASGRDICIHR